MGFWDTVKSTYKKVDTKLGGYLPGGQTPTQVKASSSDSTSTSSGSTSSPAPNYSPAPTSSTPTYSGGGSSGGGGGSTAPAPTTSTTGWSGKVENIDTGETVYYYDNKEVGRISGGGGGGERIYTPTSDKSYNLEFNRGSNVESVNLTPTAANISTGQIQTQTQLSQDSPFTFNPNPIETGLHSVPLNDGFGGQTVYSGKQITQEFGVPIVTQAEAKKYNISSSDPVYILSSSDPDEMRQEFAYASNLPYTSRAMNTKDLAISNLANIRTGQALYKKGVAGETDINIDAVYAGGVKQAKADYSTKPRGERALLYATGAAQGLSSVAINTIDFAGSMALTFGAGKTMKYETGGIGGEIANYPVAKGARLGSPAIHATAGTLLIGGASLYGRAKKVGKYAAVSEAASIFSPVRMKSGVYGGRITSGTKFTNVKSYKYTAPGEIPVTTRVYKGSSGNIGMVGFERSVTIKGQTYGSGRVVTQAPYTEIKSGGAIIESGVRTTIQPYSFKPVGTGKGYVVKPGEYFNIASDTTYGGGVSRVITGKGITSYKTPTKTDIYIDTQKGYYSTTGGITSGDKAINKFISGGAKPNYKTTYYGDTRYNINTGQASRDYISAPTGKYKVAPRFSGTEVNLNKLIGQADKGYISYGGTGGKTSLSQTFAKPSPMVSPQVSATNLKTSTYAPTIVRPDIKMGGTPNIKNVQMNKIKQNIIKSSVILAPAVVTSSSTKAVSMGRSAVMPQIAAAFKPMVTFKPALSTIQIPALAQAQASIQKQSYKLSIPAAYPGVTPGTPYTPYTPPRPVLIPAIPSFKIGGFGGGLGRTIIKGGKRSTGYVPSFRALVFKIRGGYKKGGALSKSGIDFRPITPGFKFKSGLRTNIKLPKIL